MSGVRWKFLMTLHQPAIVVIYFLPQPRGFFKLRFRIKNHFLEHYLPAPLATLPAKPITAAVPGKSSQSGQSRSFRCRRLLIHLICAPPFRTAIPFLLAESFLQQAWTVQLPARLPQRARQLRRVPDFPPLSRSPDLPARELPQPVRRRLPLARWFP